MIIKVLLIGAALGFGILILRERVPGQHQLLRRIAGLVVVVAGIVAVLWPMVTTYIANAIGVGRGTDLLLYVLVVVFVYNVVATTQRIHQLESKVIVLTRELAIQQVLDPHPARDGLLGDGATDPLPLTPEKESL